MPCSITDGPQYEDFDDDEEDEDAAYERERQREIDEEYEARSEEPRSGSKIER